MTVVIMTVVILMPVVILIPVVILRNEVTKDLK